MRCLWEKGVDDELMKLIEDITRCLTITLLEVIITEVVNFMQNLLSVVDLPQPECSCHSTINDAQIYNKQSVMN